MKKTAKDTTTGNALPTHPAYTDDPNQEEIDWALSEIGFPGGSTLSGSNTLLEDYPEEEANSKKTKRTNTGKGKKSSPKTKK